MATEVVPFSECKYKAKKLFLQNFCIKNEEKYNFVSEMRVQTHIFSALSISFFAFAAIFAAHAQSQERRTSALVFGSADYDFGDIREEAGPVTHTFTFTNNGSEPVVIVSSSVTCGCTTSNFSRRPVKPSAQGTVEVTYDPSDRPGRFDKAVTIFTSEQCEPLRLHIRGNVIPREKSIGELYPIYIGGGLGIETNFHSFSYVEHNKSIRTSVGIINTSRKPVTVIISNISDSNVYRAEPSQTTLQPGARGDITIVAEIAPESGIYGTLTEHFAFVIDGRRSDAELVVTGIAIDNRDERPDNFLPKGEINKNIVKFGVLKHNGEARTEEFDILNSGEAPLHIRAIEGLTAGTGLTLKAGDSIPAGERRRVRVTITPPLKGYGPSVEYIRVITDDPMRPMRDVKITFVVEE